MFDPATWDKFLSAYGLPTLLLVLLVGLLAVSLRAVWNFWLKEGWPSIKTWIDASRQERITALEEYSRQIAAERTQAIQDRQAFTQVQTGQISTLQQINNNFLDLNNTVRGMREADAANAKQVARALADLLSRSESK